MSKPTKWFMFDGVRVSTRDEDNCGVSCGDYECTRLPGHPGEHIAHVFSEETGKPEKIVAVKDP